jgi:Skp family chaperone for outer membrane proteins
MKYPVLAASLLLGAASAAFAQAPAPAAAPVDVPKAKCEPKPTLPSARMMEEPNIRRRFQKELDDYKKCMVGFVDERKASMKAHEAAANATVEEYNKVMKDLQEAQKAQQ